MNACSPQRDPRRPAPETTSTWRDRGVSLVEVLVAVVLMGTAVLATLAALHTTVIGTRLSRDHAKAYQWLQSADGVLQATPRVSCDYSPATVPTDNDFDNGEHKVRRSYEQLIRATVVNPDGWEDWQLRVLYPVKVWDGLRYWEPAAAPKPCYDPDGYFLQLITLQVSSPDGDIIETTQVVKRD